MGEAETRAASVLVEQVDAVRILTLNRPEKLNAADLEMQQRLLARLEDVAADPTVRALIMTGAGRAFSAGGDRETLRQVIEGRGDQRDALGEVHVGTIRCMLGLSIPVIAAVPGPAVGYAAGLVAMCDIVVMGEAGFLSDPHVRFGIQATTAAQLIWPRRTSEAFARDILMTGRKVEAREAVDIGLANRLCPTGQEMAVAMEIARTFVALPVSGVAATKRAFNRPLLRALEDMLAEPA
jgi:enoyl-CoA hydratase